MTPSKKNVILKLFSYFKPYKCSVFFALLALICTAGAIVSYGFLARVLVEAISNNEDVNSLFYFKVFCCISAVLAIAGFFRSYLINTISFRVISLLRQDVFAKCLNFPMKYFDNEGYNSVVNVILKDLQEVFNLFAKNVTFFLRNLLLLFAGLFLMISISPKLLLVMLLVVVVLFFPLIYLIKKFKKSFSEFKEVDSGFSSFVSQSLHFVKLIKSSNAQLRITEDMKSNSADLLMLFDKKIFLQSLMVAVAILFSFLAIALIIFFGSNFVAEGLLTYAQFTSFLFNAVIFSIAMVGLAQCLAQIIKITKSASDSFAIFEGFSEDLSKGRILNLGGYKELTFDNVSFSYPCKDEKVLDSLSFKVELGSKVLLSATSGSGKSTIFSILLRFYEIGSGSILFDSDDLKSFSVASVRDSIYFTMQDSFLLSSSVCENLIFPDLKIPKQDIKKLISTEKSLHFINNLPDGIDTNIGSHGAKLSGGQKQRISILRALLSDAKILIFDESMSQLDSENEREMFSLIDRMTIGKTVIFVSHKSNNDLSFDKIIEL